MSASAGTIGGTGADVGRHRAGSPFPRTIVYRPLCAATITRPTRLCLRGRRPRRVDGWEAYLAWCARFCDCVRCNRETI